MYTSGNDIMIRVNGTTICYDDNGTGNIPVIFIHGFPFDKSSWQPQVDFLKNTNRVIAYDHRGFGKSVADDAKFTMALFADDLINLMDLLQIDKATVCGLSMGGYVLLNAVNRYPQRFHSVILSDTQCIADSPEAKEKRYNTIKKIEEVGLTEFADGFVKNIFCNETHASKIELVQSIKKIILSTDKEIVMRTLAALAERDETCSTLGEIKIPALILCGKEDIVTPPAQSEFLSKNIPGSKYHVIEKAGHLSNLEQPVEFNRELNNFLTAN